MRKAIALVAVGCVFAVVPVGASPVVAEAAPSVGTVALLQAKSSKKALYKNCTALNKVYKHGVGRSGARDKTSGKRVTNFRVTTKVYNLNKKRLDRDKDGIACEKR